MKVKVSIVTLILALPTVLAFRQELSFHQSFSDDVPGNSFVFRAHVPDTSLYSLRNISRICYTGVWMGYERKNFLAPRQNFSGPGCVVPPVSDISQIMASFRHLGAWETDQAAVSLYEGGNFDGEELIVDRSPFAGIFSRYQSLAVSGKSGWTFFEGTNFEGKSSCVLPSKGGLMLQRFMKIPLRRIGSLFEGCSSRSQA